MERKVKILSFERDDHEAKLFESAIELGNLRYELKRVSEWKDYIHELMTNNYDCIVCGGCDLKDYERISTLKSAKEITPYSTFIFLSSSETNGINNEITRRYKSLNSIPRKNLMDINSKIIESMRSSVESSKISNYWG